MARKYKLFLAGWHGYNATGDDILGKCVKMIFSQSAKEMNIKIEFIDTAQDADLNIIGGGTLLGAHSSNILKHIDESPSPLVIFGGGFRREARELPATEEKCLWSLVNRAFLIGVRGFISKQFFIQAGCHREIEVIGDPGIVFEPIEVPKLEGKFKVGVFVRNMGKAGEPQYTNNKNIHQIISSICDFLAQEHEASLYFFSFAENKFDSDLEGIKAVQAIVKSSNKQVIIEYTPDPVRAGSIIGQMDYVVSQRLHPTILAWVQNIPCIALDYQFGKTADFMNSIGMDEFVIRSDEFNLDFYKNMFIRLQQNKDIISTQAARSITYLKDKLQAFATCALNKMVFGELTEVFDNQMRNRDNQTRQMIFNGLDEVLNEQLRQLQTRKNSIEKTLAYRIYKYFKSRGKGLM